MNISELDIDKLKQCIANETIRLDNCREALDKLKKEYKQKRYLYLQCILPTLEDKISDIEDSITSGEQFLESCKNQLNKLSLN